jgi:hypothetical protein
MDSAAGAKETQAVWPVEEQAIRNLLFSLDLPHPEAITPLRATAAYHAIYIIDFPRHVLYELLPATTRNSNGTISLVLRVSGDHIRSSKTLNEVAVMKYVRNHTAIPVPAVVRYDASWNNPLGREYTLLERVRGRSVDTMYDELSEDVKIRLVKQLTDILLTISQKDWSHVGGLRMTANGEYEPGPVMEDTFWMLPDIKKYWGDTETVETLNPKGPYANQVTYVQAYLQCFIHAIQRHHTLAWLRDLNIRLQKLMELVPDMPGLFETRLILAHKDLHFCNVMATEDGLITGIIDWEFAGIVPANRWDPVKAFLWNGKETSQAKEEKERLRPYFEAELNATSAERWWTVDPNVEIVWDVIRYVRALIEVCPKGQQQDKVGDWRKQAEKALDKLHV